MKPESILEESLFETRPYVEYWDELKKLVEKLWKEASNREEFIRRLEDEMRKAKEPFKTDIKIFIQKFRAAEESP
ncbi:hypothetical protein [Thermococcus sp.]